MSEDAIVCAEVHSHVSSLVLAQHSTLDFNLNFKDLNTGLLLSLAPVMCLLSVVKRADKGHLNMPLAVHPNRACRASLSFHWEVSEPAVFPQRFGASWLAWPCNGGGVPTPSCGSANPRGQLVTDFSAVSEPKRTSHHMLGNSMPCCNTCNQSFLLFAYEVMASTQFFTLEFEKNLISSPLICLYDH